MEHRPSLVAIDPELRGEDRQILGDRQSRAEGHRGLLDRWGSCASDAWGGVRLEAEEGGHPGRRRFADEDARRWVDCAVELLEPSAEPCRWAAARSGA